MKLYIVSASLIFLIKTKADRPEKRLIMEFGFQFNILLEDEIIIQLEDGSFTPEYIDLTSEYYLNLKSAQSAYQ